MITHYGKRLRFGFDGWPWSKEHYYHLSYKGGFIAFSFLHSRHKVLIPKEQK